MIKALTGPRSPRTSTSRSPNRPRDADWKARKSKSHYSGGERVALYLAMAIHIAQDISKHTFAARPTGTLRS